MTEEHEADLPLLEAVADPTRLAILRQLSADGPTCACELTGGRPIGQSTVSHHLRVLRDAGWIAGERRGTWIWYAIRPEAVARFRAIAEGIEAGRPRPAGQLGRASRGGRRGLEVLQPAWRQW